MDNLPERENLTGRKPSYIVAIGASAGGLNALEQFFDHMPTDSGMAFIIIQHLSPDFKSLMDDLLSRRTSMPIHRVTSGIMLQPDSIYLIPPKTLMTIRDQCLYLTEKSVSSHLELPIDIFFNSLAEDAGERAIAVVLSGSGSDGSRGVIAIHQHGGLVVVQSPESAQFDGMPRSSLATNICDFILAPDRIPRVLLEYIANPHELLARRHEDLYPTNENGEFAGIFALLRRGYNLDFSQYKDSTVTRRIRRRMDFRQLTELPDYVAILSGDPEELDLLYHDLLIGVTEFFRDAETFDYLEREIIPQLFARLQPGEDLRVWSASCATGEEAYSLAMLLAEKSRDLDFMGKITVFATDVHKGSLDFASHGIYDRSKLQNLGQARLEKFFKKEGENFRVISELRKMVVFAPHNLLNDPPFTRMDLISCRNLLIYLQPNAQEKVISLFQFALKQHGILFLGKSEGVGGLAPAFEVMDGRHKVLRKIRDSKLPLNLSNKAVEGGYHGQIFQPMVQNINPRNVTIDRQLLADYDALLASYMPPGVLVDQDRQIFHYFGNISAFLKPQEGRIETNLMNLVDDNLVVALSTSFSRAERMRKKTILKKVRVNIGGEEQFIDLTITPLFDEKTRRTHYHVSFDRTQKIAAPPPAHDTDTVSFEVEPQFRQYVADLEGELQSTRESLQSTIEELQTSNEELQAANEELLAANEELQSTNEELHSVNEELYSVNAEFELKNTELRQLDTDHENLLASLDTGVIFLDADLRIRKFNPAITSFFKLLPQDVGRPIDHIAYHLAGQKEMLDNMRQVLASSVPIEKEVMTQDNQWFLFRILPFKNERGKVEGVVLTFTNITHLTEVEQSLKHANEELRENAHRFRQLANSLPQLVWTCEPDGSCDFLSQQWLDYTGIPEAPQLGFGWLEQLHPDDREPTVAAWNEAVAAGTDFQVEFRIRGKGGTYRWFDTRAIRLRDSEGNMVKWFGANTDISKRKLMEDELRRSEERYRVLFEQSGIIKLIIDPETGGFIDASPAACEFYGYTREAIQTMVVEDINALSSEEIEMEKQRAQAEGRDVLHLQHRLASGEIRQVECLSNPLEIGGHRYLYLVVVDVSEKKRLEERLQMAEKSDSLGRMAKAIAHNFNNMLSAVIGNLEIIKDESWRRPNLEPVVDQALMASQRAATISRFMLTYLGQTKGKMEPIDSITAVTGTCSLLGSTLPKNVHLHTELPEARPCTVGDDAHLTQILSNIITNSIESLGEQEGEIVVSVDTVSGDALRTLRLFPLNWMPTAETYIAIAIGDTGKGINPADLNKIFDPFFSTKFAGRGLGLSVALGLLRGFQGAVAVNNNPERGATFQIFLPEVAERLPAASQSQESLPVDDLATGLVLVVDDEPVIRNLAKTVLERKFNYRVVTAADGFEALEILRSRKDEARLVILDMVMPGIDGWATLEAMREVQPDIKVILSSGYSEAQVDQWSHPEQPQAYLPKPYGVRDLEAALVAVRRAALVGKPTMTN